jgi:putative inorganic carbon (HCO3(-)) transporter
MRDILITAIVLGWLPFIFRHAWIGILLWTWLSIMNPHRLAWGFAYDAPFAAMAAVVTLIALFTTRDRIGLPRAGAFYLLVAFIVWMCVTTLMAIFPGTSLSQFNTVIKIMLMTIVAMAVLHEQKHLRLFVWVNALSLAFFGVKGGLYTIATAGGGRVWGPGGFIGGNNEIGLAILVVIPLLYYLFITSSTRWIRMGLVAAMVLSAVAVLGTQSRGAALAIAVMTGMLWLRSPGHKLITGLAIALVGVVLVMFMPDSWHDRMSTIGRYEEDSSAMGRIHAWQTALNIANDRVTGAGFDTYNAAVFSQYAPTGGDRAGDPSIVRAAHSIYFQILGEHGWVGLLLFLGIWILMWRDASRLRRLAGTDPHLKWLRDLAGMCQVALAGYATGGAFLSLAYFDLPYNLLVIVLVMRRWLERELHAKRVAARSSVADQHDTAGVPFGARR